MDADVISFEASRSNLVILDELKAKNFQTQVGPGVYDIHSPRVPAVDEIAHTIQAILAKVPKEKFGSTQTADSRLVANQKQKLVLST